MTRANDDEILQIIKHLAEHEFDVEQANNIPYYPTPIRATI